MKKMITLALLTLMIGDIVSTADKGRYADDRITVIWKPSDLPEISHLSHTVSVILLPLEKNCKSTANQN
jgi:hypothetical protein